MLEEPQPQPIRKGWRGKVAIVTGGATGLGRAIAMEFGKLGCHVSFCFVNMPGRDVSEQALLTETALMAMGVNVLACRCDVRDREAVELGPANVNVNAVAPGFIRTERMAMLPSEVIERAQKSSVLGRVAEPDDVAHVISFLCSESARHITGQTIVVDGGLSLE